MQFKRIALFLILIVLLLLAGCWDAYEIRDYTLISLMGIDKNKDKLTIYIEYNNENQQSSEGQNPIGKKSDVLIVDAEDFTQSRMTYDRSSKKEVFLGTIRSIVFSDEFAKSGIEEYLNRIRGVRGYGKTLPLYTTNTNFEELLDSKKLNTQSIGYDLEHKSEFLVKHGMAYKGDVSIIMENIQVKNTAYVLCNVDVVNNAIEMTGYSILNDNKKIGFIPSNQMNGVNYLILDKTFSRYTFDFENIKVALNSKVKKKRIRAHYDGENIIFSIKLKINSELLYFSEKISLDDNKLLQIQDTLSTMIKEEVQNAIDVSQTQYECDYLFFYKAFREKYSSAFKNMNWNEKYKNARFEISVETEVKPANLVNFE